MKKTNLKFNNTEYIQKRDNWINAIPVTLLEQRLPSCQKHEKSQEKDVNRIEFIISNNKLIEIANNSETSMLTILSASLSIMSRKFFGRQGLIWTDPSEYTSEMLIPLYVKVDENESLKKHILMAKDVLLDAYRNQDYPYDMVIKYINNRDNLDVEYKPEIILSTEQRMNFNHEFSWYISFRMEEKYIVCNLYYEKENFKESLVRCFIKHFNDFIDISLNHLDKAIKDIINSIFREEQNKLNKYEVSNYHINQTIIELFKKQVGMYPEKIAVSASGETLSFSKIDYLSDCLAYHINKHNNKNKKIVGLMTDRSVNMIIGILGILKSGAAYLPIDVNIPEDRLDFILQDSQADMIATQLAFKDKFTNPNKELIYIDNCHNNDDDVVDINNVGISDIAVLPEDMAYAIYTSGSSGNPKGVMVSHRSVVNLVYSLYEYVYKKLNSDLKIALMASYTFDASVQQIFASLLLGHELHIIPNEIRRDGNQLWNYYEINGIDVSDGTPSHLKLLSINTESNVISHAPASFIIGGERLDVNTVKQFFSRFTEHRKPSIYNVYGLTECCVDSTIYEINQNTELQDSGVVSIGIPVLNTKIYILDQDMNILPAEVNGEICISGVGISNEYINNPMLTKERFIENPYCPGEIIYRTGDQGKWLMDGNIEFAGRLDRQVKIRGYRIEPGEIENVFIKTGYISAVAVIIDKENETLIAYTVPAEGYDERHLKDIIKQKLPEYMIPSRVIQIESLPLNVSGKLDESKLLLLDKTEEHSYILPSTELERELVQIWSELLGVENVGIDQNFFDLGGHSLKATILAYKINESYGVEVPINVIFDTPTICELAAYIEKMETGKYRKIEKAEEKEYYEVSSAQRRMYILNQFNDAGIAYNVPSVLRYKGELDTKRFKQALDQLMERHEILRTSIREVDGILVQCINRQWEAEFEIFEKKREEEIDTLIHQFIRPFDLEKGNLLRAAIIPVDENEYVIMYDMPHSVVDGVSLAIFVKDFLKLYKEEPIEEQLLQYRDFSEWQNKLLQSEEIKKQEEYWKQQLGGELPVLELPYDYTRPPVMKFEGSREYMEISPEMAKKIKQLALKTETTEYIVLLAIMNILLMKYSGQEDIIIGTAIAGRTHADTETMAGMFVNMLAIRNRLSRDQKFNEFLEKVKEVSLSAFENQDYPFEELLEKLDVHRDMSRNPVYDVMFTMQNLDVFDENIFRNTAVQEYKWEFNVCRSDINVIAFENNNLYLLFEYNTSLFKRESIVRMGEHFKQIAEEILADENKRLCEIEMLREDELQEEIWKYNETEHLCLNRSVIEMIEEQAEKDGARTAIEDHSVIMSYAELNEEAGKLGSFLQERGIGKGSIVGICLERSADFMISVLGVQKAGGIYLPIDTGYPEERIRYMLADSGAAMVLVSEKWKDKLPEETEVIEVEQKEWKEYTYKKAEKSEGEDLVYVMYTSGTTGQPKGAMITHKGLQNYVGWAASQYTEGEEVFPLYTSISFDLTVTSMYVPLVSGGKIVVYREEGHENLIERIQEENCVTVMKATPTHLKLLNKEKLRTGSRLKSIIVGGEAFKTETAREIDEASEGRISLYNEYGPTETVVGCMIYKYNREKDQRATVPIGKPAWNSRIYLLDKGMKAVAQGIAGEIYIGGSGVGKGYINKEEITKEKFVEDPHRPGEKLYKSGDLGVRLINGDIEYTGRIDEQIKIRGYRIEPGEIESVILRSGTVRSIVVDTDEEKESLYAYVVSGEGYQEEELKRYLKEELPGYMIPGRIIQVEELPVTGNGKVDRSKLSLLNKPEEHSYVLPSTELEKSLAQIWSELLGVENVGIDQNFFDLGGHSLKATILAYRISESYGVEFPINAIFDMPTIYELASYIEKKEKGKYQKIEKAEEKEYYEVSSAQHRMYILSQFDDAGIAYNVPYVLRYNGTLDIKRFKHALDQLMERHEILRTSIREVNGKLVQCINQQWEAEFNVFNQKKEEEIDVLIHQFIRPFDLETGTLLRAAIIPVIENEYIIMYDMPHSVVDGISMAILVKDFLRLYKGEPIEEQLLQYRDFSEWQNKLLQSEAIKKQEEYWKQQLGGELPVLELPYDYIRPSVMSFEGNREYLEISEEMTDRIKQFVSKTETTTYIVLLAVLNILLMKYSGQEDIIIGTAVAGRTHADTETIAGMFVNMLAIRNQLSNDLRFNEFLKKVKETSLEAYENQDYQFETLLEKLDVHRDMSRNPIYDIMFTVQNLDIDESAFADLAIEEYKWGFDVCHSDLNIIVSENSDKLIVSFEYNTALFKRDSIVRMGEHFKQITEEILADENKRLCEIEMLQEDELQEEIWKYNKTEHLCLNRSVIEMIEEQAENDGTQIAVEDNGVIMSYAELDEEAGKLGSFLQDRGIRKGSIVGICLERSVEFMISVLGVQKAGGIYLPIDTSYPEERIRYMLADSGAEMALSRRKWMDKLPEETEVIEVEQREWKEYTYKKAEKSEEEDLVYVMYTSGTTGKPKGAMITHKGLQNYVEWAVSQYTEGEEIFPLYTSISFDLTVTSMYVPLVSGGKIVIYREEGHENLIERIQEDNYVTVMKATPTHLKLLNKEKLGAGSRLKKIIVGGEAFKTETAREIDEASEGRISLYNEYGPTETVVGCMIYKYDREQDHRATVPIGKPVWNSRIYLLDKGMKAAARGITGEIYIGGSGVGKGYIGKEEITKEKFVEDPYRPGEKLYKSGDLGIRLINGDIEYTGRIDEQIKIRGYRIEPGEIESVILRNESIRNVVVVADEERESIYAYVVPGEEYQDETLKGYLREELPGYMIPDRIIQVVELPVTRNGKIDKEQIKNILPEEAEKQISEAANRTEEKLKEIWEEILQVEGIGMEDDFFDLGGHSLKINTLINEIHRVFKKEIPFSSIFEASTIRELAVYIEKEEKVEYQTIGKAEEKEYYAMSSAQKRIYIVNQLDDTGINYNAPCVLMLEGVIDRVRLEEAFRGLVERHESLRTSFELIEGKAIQRIHKDVSFNISYIENEEQNAGKIVKQFIQPFDLGKPPLIRVGLIKVEEEKNIIIIDLHHIISDGVTIEILLREFGELYEGQKLPEMRLQYKDFSEWQNELVQTGEIKRQEEYWLNEFSGEIPVLNMPTDYPRPTLQSHEGDTISMKISKELASSIEQLAKDTGVTLYMIMLGVYNILLSKYTGQEDIVVGTPISGRTHADLENIAGMFVNMLAMRNYPESDKTFIEFLMEIKENSLKAYENQDYQFEELVDKLNVTRNTGRSPLFDTVVAVYNPSDTIDMIGGLKVKPYDYEYKLVKFDMSLNVVAHDESMVIFLQYCTKLFTKVTVEKLIQTYINILTSVTSNSEIKLSDIEILSKEEKEKELYRFNRTAEAYPSDKTINQLFEEQVEKTPDNIAIESNGERLTYVELNQKANQIGWALREKRLEKGSIIGILADRSPEAVIAMLAVLKAGGTYLPIDPEYPRDRIEYMLRDSEVNLLLAQGDFAENIGFGVNVINIEEMMDANHKDTNNLGKTSSSEDLAYIIYTSGSTGIPKGAMITQKGLVNYVWWAKKVYTREEKSDFPLYTSISFDLTVTSIYTPLITGNKLVVYGEEDKAGLIRKIVEEDRVDIVKLTPTHLRLLEGADCSKSRIKKLIVGGEDLKTSLANRVYENFGREIEIYNEYGPTETVVGCMIHKYDRVNDVRDSVPIGVPADNVQIYVLDKHMKPVPEGVEGELFISGDGVCKGYINKLELTAEKFVANPFISGEIMYKTGDLARRLADGNLEFIGRKDSQVKIRGYRVEIGEIESILSGYEKIKEAVVVAINEIDGASKLCAYISCKEELSISELQEYLNEKLPYYMVPSAFYKIDKLPLTQNGKVDYKALVRSTDSLLKTSTTHIEPQNDIEKKVAKAWSEILGIESIGINDNFFELGGTSLDVIILTERLKEVFNKELSPILMFTYHTVSAYSMYLEKEDFLASEEIKYESKLNISMGRMKKNVALSKKQ